jgi:hypothetical protein
MAFGEFVFFDIRRLNQSEESILSLSHIKIDIVNPKDNLTPLRIKK